TRGICTLDEENRLVGVAETSNIVKTGEGAAAEQADKSLVPVDADSLVSMNMWGFQPEFIQVLEEGFVEFLKGVPEGDLKKEYLLPIKVDELIRQGKASVTVLRTDSQWFGVTYQEDRAAVVESIGRLVDEGVYSNPLYS